MNKKTIYVILVFFLLTVTFGFSNWINKDQFSFKENDVTAEEKLFKTEHKTQSTFACASPSDQGVKNLKSDEATIYWNDDSGDAWEYIIQFPTDPYPTGSGTPTTVKEVTITQDSKGNNLQPNTTYEFYVRTDCGADGTSDWERAFAFKTQCTAYTIPFGEGFNIESLENSCWTSIDANHDLLEWNINEFMFYEGTAAAFYAGDISGTKASIHDEWLISPLISLDSTKLYKLSYHYMYMSDDFNSDAVTVKISTEGIGKDNFLTTLLENKNQESSSQWEKNDIYMTGISGDINIGWHINTPALQVMYFLDNITIFEVECAEPEKLNVKNIESNKVTIFWEDNYNDTWQYVVQQEGGGHPDSSGTIFIQTNNTENNITKENGGANLQPDTEYEFYVRSKCSKGTSEWSGPYLFRTPCLTTLPLLEGFETSSVTRDCWNIYNKNSQGGWELSSKINLFEGAYNMHFNGGGGTYDDWLISPTITMDDTKIYKLSFYYSYYSFTPPDHQFEILLSNTGSNPDNFTTVLSTLVYPGIQLYQQKVIYIQNVSGNINLAWHIASQGGFMNVFMDLVSVEEVDCIDPDQIEITNIDENSVSFSWNDEYNSVWEYYISDGGPPIGSGVISNKTTATATRDNNSGNSLQPNTEYRLYVRSACEKTKFSKWVGPLIFKTLCTPLSVPFWEGFNSDSTSFDCWTLYDNNNDRNLRNENIWRISSNFKYEGNRSMYFQGNYSQKLPHDDWLISPPIQFDINKYYRLRYFYKVSGTNPNDFRVLLSNSGVMVNDFTTVLDQKVEEINTNWKPDIWKEETLVIGGVGGNIHIAWNVNSSTSSANIYLDNISVEEIQGCPEPMKLFAENQEPDKVIISWEDEYNTKWEYVVQEAGSTIPTISGTSTSVKEVIITQDKDGQFLQSNTEYEFYVRSQCSDGYSLWSGPYSFRTACAISVVPFWEGFNDDSKSIYCWTIIDGNEDAQHYWVDKEPGTPYENMWFAARREDNIYEGNGMMRFYGGGEEKMPHDDWLISPTISFEKDKVYRLKYHYKSDNFLTFYAELEVLLSNSGTNTSNFNFTVVDETKFKRSEGWQKEYVFIKDIEGEINLAWHVIGKESVNLYLDNIFVEEVKGCPEPLNIEIYDLQANKVTIGWTDEMGGTQYEYYIQKEGLGIPTSSGVITKAKKVDVNQDSNGNLLEHNTDYDFYVRTDCGDGTYSIWQGPYTFTTLCDVFDIPFLEGFNSDSESLRCWERPLTPLEFLGSNLETLRDVWYGHKYRHFEGDNSIFVANLYDPFSSKIQKIISPKFELEGKLYVVKYRYFAGKPLYYNLDIWIDQIVLKGKDTMDHPINQVLKSGIKYSNNNWEEEVVFVSGISGELNIEWNVTHDPLSDFSGVYYFFGMDNFSITEVENCTEPYHIKVINQTKTSIEIEWEHYGDSSEWEVIVVKYGGTEDDVPIQTKQVKGDTNTIITGLEEGKSYTIFIRAKCTDGITYSDWSSAGIGSTSVADNDNCTGAFEIPVNNGTVCMESVSGTLIGATETTSPSLKDCDHDNLPKNDVWFKFEATSKTHILKVFDLKAFSTTNMPPVLYATIYDQNCGNLKVLYCFEIEGVEDDILLKDLIIGNNYYVRLGNYEQKDENGNLSEDQPDFGFNICIVTPSPIEVSPSGELYTVEELVKDVLVKSNCDLVSNVHYQNGDGSPAAQTVNTFGYFNKGNSVFPFEEGIVLSTNEVKYVPGPFNFFNGIGNNIAFRGNNPYRWLGDEDINDAINDAGGLFGVDKRVTLVEFDFIPITDSIQFEYLFASNSYIAGCGHTCDMGALFAAWLIDTETGEGQNLAKIKGTDIPIALNTIWDSEKILNTVCSNNTEFFWNNYSSGTLDPIEAPFDFAGSTIAMDSEVVYVVPGRQYHIKLAVMDFCPNPSHSSAVFFNAGSFDLGTLDLGEDLLIETNTALCEDESVVIRSGVTISEELNTKIEWKKDGVIIPGATEVDLEVRESGVYTVQVDFVDINCQREDSITVEMYPPISETVHQAKDIIVCRQALEEVSVNLISVETEMFKDAERSDYTTEYYKTIEEAEASENAISNVENYALGKEPQAQTLYIRVESIITGCHEIFELHIQPEQGAIPDKPSDVTVCAEYVFPEVNGEQYYYMQPGGEGKAYKTGDVLAEPGEHTIYLLQINNEEGCYEETAYKVKITAPVVVDVFEDQTLICEYYELKPLSEYNQYFTESGGNGDKLYPGMQILEKQIVYVYASSEDYLCTDESSFTIDYEDCPIPRGISPNNDGLNDVFDLTPHGVENIKIYNRWGTEVYSHGAGYTTQWHGQNKNGKQLPGGTYYYVIIAHGKTRTGWVQINK